MSAAKGRVSALVQKAEKAAQRATEAKKRAELTAREQKQTDARKAIVRI